MLGHELLHEAPALRGSGGLLPFLLLLPVRFEQGIQGIVIPLVEMRLCLTPRFNGDGWS